MAFRTHNCNELRADDAGKKVKIAGWLDSKRDKGGLLFAVIRDFYGTTQVVCSEEPMLSAFRDIPTESTVSVEGTVVLRSAPNDKLPTGKIEVIPQSVEVLGRRTTQALPFEISKGSACVVRRPSTSTDWGMTSILPVGSLSLGAERRTTVPSTETVDSVGMSRKAESMGSSEHTTCVVP